MSQAPAVDNHGERLVPGESYHRAEAIRHKSSYLLFRAVIEADLRALSGAQDLRILDLGCGVGHGTLMLADLPGVEIVGVDAGAEAIAYARENYGAPNLTYVAATAQAYLDEAGGFDYVVSRHALEHIPDGLAIALRFTCRRRLIVNVPYLEPAHDEQREATNRFHELSDISEADFADYPRAELLYEDMQGVTTTDPQGANSIVCISSAPDLPPALDALPLPFPAWEPNKLEQIALDSYLERTMLRDRNDMYQEQLAARAEVIEELKTVLEARASEYRADVARLREAFEERAALDEARYAELRTAYDDLVRTHGELRASRAVAGALRLRGLSHRLRPR